MLYQLLLYVNEADIVEFVAAVPGETIVIDPVGTSLTIYTGALSADAFPAELVAVTLNVRKFLSK